MIRRFAAVLCLAGFLVGCNRSSINNNEADNTILVFSAASLVDVLKSIELEFEETSDIEVDINFAGSGTLAKQILAGANADVFISANESWMNAVEKEGRVVGGTRFQWLSNQLVVVANVDAEIEFESPLDFLQEKIAFLAVGDPAYVPAGKYAKQWLEKCALKEDETGGSLWEVLQNEHRCTYASDVRGALRQVLASRSVVGIVYRTDYLEFSDKLQLLFEVPEDSGVAVTYSAAATWATSDNSESADAFLDFLKTEIARRKLEAAGFEVLVGVGP